MKKSTLFLFALVAFCTTIFCQSPQAFKYQGVIRNSIGELIPNQTISLRISIRNLTASGTILYRETHMVTTNDFGLASVNIGQGTLVSGSFETINWGVDDKFLSIDLDLTGGNSFVAMGTSQVLNVPYSLHAKTAAGLTVMTSAQRDGILSPQMGMQVYNSETRLINYYDGYGWLEIIGVKQADFICGNPLLDSRDGQYYNTIDLAGSCWMAENLNYGVMINGTIDQSDNGIAEKYCYANNQSLCDYPYGALYQWNEMMQYSTSEGTQGICPDEWHLPTEAEWTILVNSTGGSTNAGANLVQGGATGFEALMAGQTNLFTYPFIDVGQRAYFWTSTQNVSYEAWNKYIINNDAQVYSTQLDKHYGQSVRCIKD